MEQVQNIQNTAVPTGLARVRKTPRRQDSTAATASNSPQSASPSQQPSAEHPWTTSDIEKLVELVSECASALFSASDNSAKRAAWEEVSQRLLRSPDQVRRQWSSIVNDLRQSKRSTPFKPYELAALKVLGPCERQPRSSPQPSPSKPLQAPSSKPQQSPSSRTQQAPSSKPQQTPSSKPQQTLSSKPQQTPSSKPQQSPSSGTQQTPSKPQQMPSRPLRPPSVHLQIDPTSVRSITTNTFMHQENGAAARASPAASSSVASPIIVSQPSAGITILALNPDLSITPVKPPPAAKPPSASSSSDELMVVRTCTSVHTQTPSSVDEPSAKKARLTSPSPHVDIAGLVQKLVHLEERRLALQQEQLAVDRDKVRCVRDLISVLTKNNTRTAVAALPNGELLAAAVSSAL